MKAFVVAKYGKGGMLRQVELPQPTVGDRDVLVEVHAAAVNLLDCKIRSGEFKAILPYRPPFVLGHDVAGVVVRVGSGVRRFRPGDAVYARPRDGRIGTFAEFIAIHEDDVAPKPANLGMEEAASLPLVALTAWQALVERAGLAKGQKVFIQAGSGGVGTIAIQVAKNIGATVATTAVAASADLVRGLGADVVVDYRKDDFERMLSGYDVVLHSQDNAALAKSLNVLKPGGKLVSISGPPDPDFAAQKGLNPLVKLVVRMMSRRVRAKARSRGIDYSFLFMRANGDQLREVAAFVEAGLIRPVVDRVFPFDETNEALAHVETGRAKGKVVIRLK